jgi:hypothetical protein
MVLRGIWAIFGRFQALESAPAGAKTPISWAILADSH